MTIENKTRYWGAWLLHERAILMGGSLIFGGAVMYLIRIGASAEAIAIFSGILGNFTGALLRGITSAYHDDSNPNS